LAFRNITLKKLGIRRSIHLSYGGNVAGYKIILCRLKVSNSSLGRYPCARDLAHERIQYRPGNPSATGNTVRIEPVPDIVAVVERRKRPSRVEHIHPDLCVERGTRPEYTLERHELLMASEVVDDVLMGIGETATPEFGFGFFAEPGHRFFQVGIFRIHV